MPLLGTFWLSGELQPVVCWSVSAVLTGFSHHHSLLQQWLREGSGCIATD
jgi:hypothetical protein